jgi:rare lipoprotein A
MRPILIACFLLLATSVQAQQTVSDTSEADVVSANRKVQYGIASFYADKFEGRQTANGDIFSQTKMTAACNRLPLGTWIRVTNLRNKRTVIVQVNDRLHPKNMRLVDMSKIAAKKLGFTGHGITQVRVEVVLRKKVTVRKS